MRIKKNHVFDTVPTVRPGRSIFPLSYEKKFTCDMGQIIPVLCDEMVPGDHFKFGNQFVIRFQPMLAPLMHEVNVDVFYFFVPLRLLWNEDLGDDSSFTDFIVGGATGDETPTPPTWDVSVAGRNAIGTLWDFMGLPTGVNPSDAGVSDFPRRAYLLCWNEYFRDQNLQTELDITDYANYEVLNGCWPKDYFTSALLWQQRGTPPAIPIAGSTSAVFDDVCGVHVNPVADGVNLNQTVCGAAAGTVVYDQAGNTRTKVNVLKTDNADGHGLDSNTVDLSTATGPFVAQVRLGFQLTKYLERNARGGARYTEYLRANHGVFPRDDRLQRPEFCGGSHSQILWSEVLQTSETATTPQGNMAGHGIGVNTQYCGSYYAKEFGLLLGLMVIRPLSAYQQGINKQWIRRTKEDYFNPLFNHLSERAIENCEIYARAASSGNLGIWGYQGMYSEMRYKPNIICGQMRSDYDFWHLGRVFGSMPGLNADFVECIPDKRIFAVENEPGLIVNFGNLLTGIRPIPIDASPGYVDHF